MDSDIILKDLKSLLLEKFGKNINDVILFGSRSKGTGKDLSDYDVLIILNNDYEWNYRRKINDVCYEIDLKYDIFIDTQIISTNELKNSLRGKHPVFLDALKYGMHA